MISNAGLNIHYKTIHHLNVILIPNMDAVLIREIAEMIGIFVNVLVVLITESSVTRSVKFQKYVTKLMEHADVNPDLLEITVNVSNVDKQSHIFEINARFITNFRFSFWLTKLPKYQNVM
jgi:hypothetical protein